MYLLCICLYLANKVLLLLGLLFYVRYVNILICFKLKFYISQRVDVRSVLVKQ